MKGTFTKAAAITAIALLVSMGSMSLSSAGVGEGSRSLGQRCQIAGISGQGNPLHLMGISGQGNPLHLTGISGQGTPLHTLSQVLSQYARLPNRLALEILRLLGASTDSL